jgi:hypothetical protein
MNGGSRHIGAGQGLPGAVATQVQSGDPSRRTVVISQSTTVAESATYAGAARSASAIFSSLVGSLLSAMMTALLYLAGRCGQTVNLRHGEHYAHAVLVQEIQQLAGGFLRCLFWNEVTD